MNRTIRLTAQLAALLLGLALATAPVRADDLQDINRLLKQGQHAQALDRVNEYLAQKPRDAQGRFLKGLILTEEKKNAEAIEVFTKLSQDYPELPEPYNNLAVLYAAQGQYEKARQQLEMSIRTHPSYATAYENLGDVYTTLASQAYDKALQFDSTNSTAQNKLSLIHELISSGNRPARASTRPADAVEPPRPDIIAAAPKSAAAPQPKPAPEEAKAAAKPAEKPQPAAAESDEVLDTLRAWAGAWAKQDVSGYLSFYAKDFKTPKGESRTEWEKTRKQRISAPKKIEVAIESPKVTLNDSRAVVIFRQLYRSDHLQVRGSKTLVLVRTDGRWLIQEERAGS
ncbi:MAG: tetratricopeptide repeat protein [Burkholderiales bacterium]